MDSAALLRQMTIVVHAARDAVRDEAQAARLWGATSDLCDLLERREHGDSQRTMIVALREDIRTGAKSTRELVDEIVWFVRAVEHDLADEERDALAADVIVIDQTDG